MKNVLAATALAIFGLAPAIGERADYTDDSWASSSPPAQLGLAPAPAATKVPAPDVAKVVAPESVKPVARKAKAPARVPDQKLAASTRD